MTAPAVKAAAKEDTTEEAHKAAPCAGGRASACADKYDIIFIGSGLVGSAVSSKLAEMLPNKSILVLEGGPAGQFPRGKAGPANWASGEFVQWPGEWGGMTRYDVPGNYATLNSYAAGLGDSWASSVTGGLYCPKIRGGGASVNGALMQRMHGGMFEGHPDFGMSAWPRSWSASTMEPYYQEVEKLFSITPTPSADGQHYLDDSGPTQLKTVLASFAPCNTSTKACGAYPQGFKQISQRKPASGTMGIPTVNAMGGMRQSTATLLQPKALSRSNYKLLLDSEVTKILHKDGLAAGVAYTHQGSEKTALVNEGGLVVLSAGAVGTPRMLLSSGVGDSKIVGKNLSDHGMTRQHFRKSGWNITAFEFPPSKEVIASYIANQTGPLAQFGPLLTAFIRDPTTPGAAEEFDTEVFINPPTVNGEISVWYVMMRPSCSTANLKWNGTTLHLEDNNLYLSCARDVQTMQYARDVVGARMSALGATCVSKDGDECGQIVTPDKQLRTATYPINHFAGTCPLGGCVDSTTLRVHGSKNVAVADASLLPGQVWGHPAMTLAALALRAADLLVASLEPNKLTAA